MRGSLNTRMLVASALVAVLIGATFAFALVAISAERRSERLVERQSQRELTLLNEINTLVVDLETGVRGFVITGVDRFLEPWLEARAALPERGEALVRLTDDPVEDPLARQIVAAVESYIEDYAAPVVEAVRRNDPSASTVAATEAGKQRIDAIRARIDRYREIELSALEQRQQDANVAARRAIAVAAGGLVASLLLVAGLAAYLARAIVSPVRRAAAMAGRISGWRALGTAPGDGRGRDRFAGAVVQRHGQLARDPAERARPSSGGAGGPAPRGDAGRPRRVAERRARRRRRRGQRHAGRRRHDAAALPVRRYGDRRGGVRQGEPGHTGRRAAAPRRRGRRRLGADHRAVRLDRLRGRVGPGGRPMRAWGFHSATGTPVVTKDRLWGVAATSWLAPGGAEARSQIRVSELTELLAVAIANADSQAELDASRARVVAASDQARRRIERDLHDGTQQRLVSLGLDVRTAEAMVPADRTDLAATLEHVGEGLSAALNDLQELTRGIHPAILSSGGLGPALRTLARRSPVPVDLTVDSVGRLPEPVEVTVYYVVSEALANATKHANASVVHVNLAVHDSVVVLSVRDDGDGGADPTRGSGLIGLRDRAEALGGSLEITSPPHDGTTLTALIPVPEAEVDGGVQRRCSWGQIVPSEPDGRGDGFRPAEVEARVPHAEPIASGSRKRNPLPRDMRGHRGVTPCRSARGSGRSGRRSGRSTPGRGRRGRRCGPTGGPRRRTAPARRPPGR